MTRNHNLKKMSISLSAAMLGATVLALNNSKPVKADATDNDHLETDSNGQNDPVVQAKKQKFNRDETKNESIVGELKKVMSDDKSSTDNSDDSKNGNNFEENNNATRKQEFNYDHVKNGVNANTVNPQNSLQKFNDLTANVNLDDKSALNSNFISLPVNKVATNHLQLFNRNALLDSKLLADADNGKKPDLHTKANWEDPTVQGFTKTAVGYTKYYQNYNRIAKKGSVIIDNNYSNTPLQNINCNISDGFAFGVNLSATIDKRMFNDATPVLVGTIAQLNQDDRTLRWSGDENTKNRNVYDDNGQRLGYIYSERHDSSSGFGYVKGEEVDYFFIPNNDIKPAKDVSFDFHIDHSYAINCWQNHYKNLRYTSQNNPAKFQWVTLDKNSADKSVPLQVNLWQFNDHLRNDYNHVDPWVWNPSLYWQSITSNAQYTPEGDPINLPQVNQVLEVKRLPDNTGYVNLFNSNINVHNSVHYDYRLINEDGTGFYETIWRPYETYYTLKRLSDGLTNVEVQKAAKEDWLAGGYGAVYSLSSDRKSLLIGLNYDATTDRYQQLHNFNEVAFRTAIRDYAETSYTNNISHPGHLDQLVKQTVDFYKKQNYNSNNLWYEIWGLDYENHDKNVIEQVNDVTPGKTAVIGQINSQSPNGSSADVSLYRNIPVRYVDDDENGKEIGTDSIIGITKQDLTVDPSMDITVPKKYVLASYDKLDYGIVNDKDNPVITIHLKHKIIGSVGDLKENAKNTRDHLLDSVKGNPNIEIVHDQDQPTTADANNQSDINSKVDQINKDYNLQFQNIVKQVNDWKEKTADYNSQRQAYLNKLRAEGLYTNNSIDPTTISQNLRLNDNNSTQLTYQILDPNAVVSINHNIVKLTHRDHPNDFLKVTYTNLTDCSYRGRKIAKIELIASDWKEGTNSLNSSWGGTVDSIQFGRFSNGFNYNNATSFITKLKFYDEQNRQITFGNDAWFSISSLNSNFHDGYLHREGVQLLSLGEAYKIPGSVVNVHPNKWLYADSDQDQDARANTPWDSEHNPDYNKYKYLGSGLFNLNGSSTVIFKNAAYAFSKGENFDENQNPGVDPNDRYNRKDYNKSWTRYATDIPQMAFDAQAPKLELHYHNDNLMLSKTSIFQVIQKMPNGKYGQDPVVFKTTITANKDIAQDIVTGRENEGNWTGKNTNGTVQVGYYDPKDLTVIGGDGVKVAGYHFNPFNYDSKEMYYGSNYADPNRNDGNFYLVSSSNGHVSFDYLWGRQYSDDNSNITFNDFPDDQTWYLTLSPDDQTADIQFIDEDDSNKQVATSTIKGLTDQLTKLDWSNKNNDYAETLTNLYNQGYYIDLPELNNTTNPSLEDVINALNNENGQYDFSSTKDANGNWIYQYSPMVVKLKHRIASVDITASHLTQTYEVDYYIPQTGNEINHSTKLTAKYKRNTKEDLVTKKYTYGKWQLDPTSLNDLTQLSRGYVPINVSNRAGYAIEIEMAKSNSTYHETTDENDHTLLPIALGNFNNSYHDLVRKGTTAIGVNVVPSFDVNNFNLDPSNWATNTVIHVKYIPWIRQLKGHIYVSGNSTALKDEPMLSDQYHTGDTIQIDYSKLPQKVYDNLDDKQTDYEFDIPEGQMSTRYLTNLVPGENYDPYYNPDNPNASLWHGWDVIDLNTEAIYDKLPNEVKSVTRIIKINGKTVKEEVKSVRRSRLKNEATGEIVYGYYSNASFDEYKISKTANSNSYVSLNGEPAYEADQIDSLDIDEDTPDKLVYNITFDQDEAQQLVNFVTKKGVVIDSTMLTGKYGATKKADTSNLPDGWSLVNEQDAYVKVLNGTSNILVVHPIIEVTPDNSVTSNTPICGELVYPSGLTSNDLTANTSRTIVLHYPNSDPESVVQNVKFTRIGYFDPNEYDPNVADNSDCVTYSNWTTDNGTLSEYKPENYHGLTPTKDEIAKITLTKPEKNMTEDVYYNEGSKSIEVTIRDNSESSNDVKTSSRQIISGNIGEEKDIALDIAPGQYLTGISHGFSLLYDNGQYIIKANKDLTGSDHPYSANSRALRSIRHLTLKYTFGETNLPFQVFTSHELKNVNNETSTNDQNNEINVPEASLEKTISRKIIVNLPDGNVNVTNEEVKFERTAKKDMSTGKIIYTPWELAPESRNEEHYVYAEAGDKSSIDYKKGKLLGFKVDPILGYDVLNPNDGKDIIIDPNSDVNTELKDVVISYAPKMQKSAIIFVQKGINKYDSSRNVSINGQTYEIIGGRSFTGKTNETVSLKEYQHDYTIPAGYQVVKNGHPGLYDNVPDSYLFKAVNNKPIYIEVKQSPL